MSITADAQPFVSINLGNAVAALAFTLAIQQFLRPIHRFRLQTRRLNMAWIYVIIFSSAALILIGNIVRTLDFWYYTVVPAAPILEILGGAGFVLAYLILALSTLVPAVLTTNNGLQFAKGALEKLGQRNADDYIAVFRDIERNTEKLFVSARFNEDLFRGRPRDAPQLTLEDISKKDRKKAVQSDHAGMLLQFLADRELCRTLVNREPHVVLRMMRTIRIKKLVSSRATDFVQQIAKQALLSDDSVLARELEETGGFAELQDFQKDVFADEFVVRTYKPYHQMRYLRAPPTAGLAERIHAAVKASTPALLDEGYMGGPSALVDVKLLLESASEHFASYRDELPDHPSIHIVWSIKDLIEAARTKIAGMSVADRKELYEAADEKYGRNFAARIAEMAFKYMEVVANDFPGPKDRNWIGGLDVFNSLFESIGQQPQGMDPIQQRVAIMIVDKVKQNLKGYYPAITRYFLAMAGPYEAKNVQQGTAFHILRDAVYAELKGLSLNFVNNRAKIEDFLPENVRFDTTSGALIHTYKFSGNMKATDLRALQVDAPNLHSQDNFMVADRATPAPQQ